MGPRSGRQIHHLRDLRPAVADSQPFADHKAEIDHHRRVTLFDRLFNPIGSLVQFAAEQVKEGMGTGIS